jgi:hypothetical protein
MELPVKLHSVLQAGPQHSAWAGERRPKTEAPIILTADGATPAFVFLDRTRRRGGRDRWAFGKRS